MKLHKIILALTALMIISGVLVNASPQVIPKQPPIPPPRIITSPSGIIPPPPKTTPPPTTTPPPLFPPITPPSAPPTTPPSSSIPPTSPSGSKGSGLLPSQSSSNRPSGTGGTGPRPSGPTNDPIPSGFPDPTPPVTSQNPLTNTSQSSQTKDNHSNIKKAAMAGIIVVGFFGISALIFSVYRHIQRRKDYAREITSSIYSTDEMSKSDLSPPYPFSTRTNSFSNNTTQQPPRAPVTNVYDNLPPIRNGGFGGPRPEYYNYYNEGGYMRQNRPNENVHIRNRLQQTRGNVVIQPPPPPPPPQNYNWNYGVSASTKQTVPMNQGGLFPVPYVRENYGASSSNNMSGGNNNISTVDYTSNNSNYQVLTNLSVNDNDPKMDHRQEDIQALNDTASNSKLNEHISPNEKYRTSSTYSEPEYSTTSFSTTKTVQAELLKSPPEHIHERNDSYPDDDTEIYHLNAPIFKNNNNNHNR